MNRELALIVVSLLAAGCRGSAPDGSPSQPSSSTAAAVQAQVAKIVFIDKEHACECTQKAIDASWTALQTALAGASLPVERIHLDTQEAFAASFTDKRALLAVPGVYLLDERGAILNLLQGEVTADQYKRALSH